MSGSEKIYYWDSCVFLAWLKDEKTRKPGEMEGVRDVIMRLRRRELKLVTSVLAMTEVSAAKLPAGTLREFEECLSKKNVTRVSVDIKIARLARDLRDYYSERKEKYNNKTLGVPDAIHLATAIHYRVDEFHTFDSNNGNGTLGLLPLSEDLAGYKLKICKPAAVGNMELHFEDTGKSI